jgi:hypothetical protein
VKNSRDENDLKFPVSRQAFPEPRELSMDDYYEFVVSNLALFGKPPLERAAGFQPFVIREDDDEYSAKKQ